ncbi:hypothetical protein K503DRAFT_858337 [Rhizopogon vinicolor AM-OR11-026]|uniref:F-box domain-containing protein n=1 Tax=Rhizopogon vinicolor AM-OR11-026 TaxID=1314800 RepID=A0A1B7MTE7_9AGAM|nr:hypothetical protein K503DRAFT_858337 [Rhizopogon vinicolor AM-OR11-026]
MCKAFHDPAMDLLWADMEDIKPLLGCVTRLHPLIYDPEHLGIDWSRGVEPLSEYEAHQFLRHAARVRSLQITGYPPYDPLRPWQHAHLFSVIPTETCVFPRLLSLSWKVGPPDNRLLPLFLSPMLRHCDAGVDCDLKSITRRCAVLESLSFKTPRYYSHVPTAGDISVLSDAIRSCNQLVKLCCPPLDSAGWRHISNLHTLVRLEIDGMYTADLLDEDVPTLAPFLNLTALYVNLEKSFLVEAARIITIIQHAEFPSLKGFKLYSDGIPWEPVEPLFRALSQWKACQTLERVYISFRNMSLQNLRSLPVISHFLCFTQLRFLQFRVYHSIHLDNDLLLEAMSSWPHIETLKLQDDTWRPRVTFCGLFAALLLCPHLHTLQLPIDAENIDIDPKAESFQHPSLWRLHFSSSRVENPETVAFIIFSRLPLVGTVECDKYFDDIVSVWREVNAYLSPLREQVPQDTYWAMLRSSSYFKNPAMS